MTEVSFKVPFSAQKHIGRIVERAAEIYANADRAPADRLDKTSTRMDLMATHANGCQLDFKRLAEADDFNLAHDVFGIARHLDRETGKLTGFFRPRFASKQHEAA